jgi:DNA repair exonuclease SbcCD ATPase subunit
MTKARGSLLPLGRKSFLIIKTLCLDGFRSFSNARLDFLPGQNYIFGQNWQGKSSIVDAIGFALFGLDVFPKKVAGTPVSADHLVNEDCKQARVQLDFVLNDDSYTIERILPGRQVTLKNGDTIAASGTRTVAEKLNSLLSVDVKLFQNIFYSDQDELRKSLDFSPEERRVFIERLLGVEEWKQRIDLIRAAKRSLDGFLQDLIAGRLGAFLSHVEELQYDVENQEEEIHDLQKSVRELGRSSPRNMGGLRAAEKQSEAAIARLQHRDLELRTKLAIEEHLSQGVRRGRCPTCTQSIPRVLRVSRLKVLTQTIRSLRSELTKVSRDLEKLEAEFSDSDFDQSYEDVAELRETRATYEAACKQLAKDQERLTRLRTQAKTFGKKPQQVDRTKGEIAFLEKLENAIQDFRRVLRRRLVKQLMIGTNDFLSRFHDGDNDSIVKIDEELNIAVELHGRQVPIFNLSGAAKDILALALRYGLLRVAAGGISFFVLDEPTRHMDISNCRKLKGLFNDLLDCQLIVVTVNSEFSDASGRHFRVAKDESLHSVVAESW